MQLPFFDELVIILDSADSWICHMTITLMQEALCALISVPGAVFRVIPAVSKECTYDCKTLNLLCRGTSRPIANVQFLGIIKFTRQPTEVS